MKRLIPLLFCTLFFLVGYVVADEDDPDEVVHCKHCGHSIDECKNRQNCYRYTGKEKDSLILPRRAVLSWQPSQEVIQAGLPDQAADFFRIKIKPPGMPPLLGPFPPVSASIPAAFGTQTLDVIPLEEETSLEGMGFGRTDGDSNPIFLHFGEDMLVLENGIPSQEAASLLKLFSLPLGTESAEAYGMVLKRLSDIGGQFGTEQPAQNAGHQCVMPGTYLLLVKDNESLEWYTAIIIVAQQHSLMFLMSESGALETLMSSDHIFRDSFQRLLQVSREFFSSVLRDTYLHISFYPIKLASPLATPQMIEDAIRDYNEGLYGDEKTVETLSSKLSVGAQIVDINQMESITVSWNPATNIRPPVTVSNSERQKSVTSITHVEAIYKNLLKSCPQQAGGSVNTGDASLDAFTQAITAATGRGRGVDVSLMQGMLASHGLMLGELPDLPEDLLPDGSYVLVIHSIGQQEPPAILFVYSNFPFLTAWFADLSTGQINWKETKTDVQKFSDFLKELCLLPVNIYQLVKRL